MQIYPIVNIFLVSVRFLFGNKIEYLNISYKMLIVKSKIKYHLPNLGQCYNA